MKKKLLLAAASILTAFAIAGCGGKESDTEVSDITTYKVGIVQYVDDASLNQIQSSIQEELDAKGKELGIRFNYSDYTFNGQADQTTLNQIMTELVADEVDIIIPIATPTALIAQSATEDNQIPVVFAAVTNPVAIGLVESMDNPGANITGVSDALDTEAIMKLMIKANDKMEKLGILYDKSQDSSKQAVADAKKFCEDNGIEVIEKTGTTNDEITLAADALVAAKVDAVFTPTDNTVMTAELAIYEKFIAAKIPQYCGADSFALNGAFLGYGVNYEELGKETADIVVDVLNGDADVSDTAVKTINNGIATVNTETAEAIDIDYSVFNDMCDSIVEIKTAKEFE